MKALDIEAVQAFVLAADLKSFTRAAEALETAQSAVSLKIRRLEQELGRRLLERTPRNVQLSADGNAFLEPARTLIAAHQAALQSFQAASRHRLTIGISDHIVGADLPLLLRRMKRTEPGLVLEIRIAASREVLAEFDRGLVDAAIVFRHDNRRRGGEAIIKEAFGWFAAPDFTHQSGEPLPLATQAEPCSVRSLAVGALKAARIPWREVFVGGGIGTIGAAVAAGLAVAALGRRVAPRGTIEVGAQLGLPVLPARDVVMHAKIADAWARASLKTLAATLRASVG
ncbi:MULTISPECIES: LysR family transcriptional regulator [unclassified Bradyrhizobium]|uniref:LysR family transcriptional regulator n=1 Tax=unclassified Bradyrhizobium TaxID=2631580 RepID=UPI0028E5DD21|nr:MULTISPECIES: LysR family transcriptional regulator [unclassified Bradyrhizobium]